MLIMQKDLLSELHIPKLDLTSLQHILSQNSARLAYLFNENDCIKSSKAIPLHFEGPTESVTGVAELNSVLSPPGESGITLNQRFTCKKSILRRDRYFNDGLRIHTRPTDTHSAGECYNENNDEIQCVESERRPRKCNSDSAVLLNAGSFDKSKLPVTQPIANVKAAILSDVVDNPQEEKSELEKTQDEFIKSENNFSDENCLSRETNSPTTEEVSIIENDKPSDVNSDSKKNSEPALCVISEVIGNANEVFSSAGESQEKVPEAKENQLITPKKTTDITKIKGWRRKQFFVEKPTTVEYYSIPRGRLSQKKRIDLVDNSINEPEQGNVENAFVCDSLDEFLDREADLKIGYEIPHLYAEFGIKLTSDDIVSRPNLSEEDIKEVGTRYCMPITLPSDDANIDDVKEETLKRLKRPFEDDSKPCKLLKLDENKRQFRFEPKQVVKDVEIKQERNSLEPENVKSSESDALSAVSNIKLMSKLIALVVYPGPFAPLHPIVQYHLNKLRSYYTKVDENWANFAVSAVLVNDKRCKRKVLPAYCCVKTEQNPALPSGGEIQAAAEVVSVSSSDTESTVSSVEQLKLKKCSVVIEKLESHKLPDPWCMEHSCYDCSRCGLAMSAKYGSSEEKIESHSEEIGETVIVSPRASFDKNVASLLAKKVRLLKYNGDTLTSIDCLKTLTPNTIEFIKLKFVKESFLTGYISIWFLKPQLAVTRSRAFLTFSRTPPVPDAINLKSTAVSQINLPKVLTEIVSSESPLDSNEYAILHCNGEIWEIHGSLNIAFGKSDKNVEQIFTSVELPELKKLQEIAYDSLKVKSVKWWVLDLTQKFRYIEIKSGNLNTIVSRKKFLETITLNLFGFIPLRKDAENRVLGAYVIQRLLPFVLIGPYYLLETHDMILKGNSSTLPFLYYGEDNVTTNYPLKFFINSVIKNLERNDKRLEGLWLYDKMFLDSTSYLEAVTTSLEGSYPSKYSTIDIEHGYSLSSLTSCSLSGATSGIIKRRDGREELKKVTVYLYFDIFDLGFVEGELQFDNSVIINHPLDWRTKMKSHKIGDWFIGIIKRRIDFFPKDLVVRWFVTKHREDLRYRRPFNKLFLGGAHVLTRNGIFYLLELPESKIEELGLDKNEVSKSVAKCQAIREVKELKNLASLLKNKSEKTLTLEKILSKTISEIERLRKIQKIYRRKKNSALKLKWSLVTSFMRLLNSSRMRFHLKIKMIENIEHMFRKEGGGLSDDFIKKLKPCRIGRKYLNRVEKRDIAREKKNREALRQEEERKNKWKAEKLKLSSALGLSSYPKKTPSFCSPVYNVPVKILNVPQVLCEPKLDPPDNLISLRTIGSVSDQSSPSDRANSQFAHSRILKSSSLLKKAEERNTGNLILKSEPVVKNPEGNVAKGDGFIKLTSTELPGNIRLFWKNWNVKKLEVV